MIKRFESQGVKRPPREKPDEVAQRLWEHDRELILSMPDRAIDPYVQEICGGYSQDFQVKVAERLRKKRRDNARPAWNKS